MKRIGTFSQPMPTHIRLFEMGFEVQLHEILHKLPSNRQNLLFSATLPTAVAEFAKAGLVNPLLHRLDADQKISEDLQLSFFNVKSDAKDAALLALFETVLKIPPIAGELTPSTVQAIVFVATKHHVEYVTTLLSAAGFRTNHIYGSLDQVARQRQLTGFRNGHADILVVTDVAARGIDIPIMDNVVNYDFPSGVKSFIHRVGRTARAGRKGTAWSFITKDDMPYLLDLQTFVGLDLTTPESGRCWTIPQHEMDLKVEYMSALEETAQDLPTLRAVMKRGQTMYERSRPKASAASYKSLKAKRSESLAYSAHPAFPATSGNTQSAEQARLLSVIDSFTPSETVLELGNRGQGGSAELMSARRRLLSGRKAEVKSNDVVEPEIEGTSSKKSAKRAVIDEEFGSRSNYRDEEHYISHTRSGYADEKGSEPIESHANPQLQSEQCQFR